MNPGKHPALIARVFGIAALIGVAQCVFLLSLESFSIGELFIGPARRDAADNRPIQWGLLALLALGVFAYLAAKARRWRIAKALGVVLTIAFGIAWCLSFGLLFPAPLAWATATLWLTLRPPAPAV
jgi:hypothetical protein